MRTRLECGVARRRRRQLRNRAEISRRFVISLRSCGSETRRISVRQCQEAPPPRPPLPSSCESCQYGYISGGSSGNIFFCSIFNALTNLYSVHASANTRARAHTRARRFNAQTLCVCVCVFFKTCFFMCPLSKRPILMSHYAICLKVCLECCRGCGGHKRKHLSLTRERGASRLVFPHIGGFKQRG